MSSHSQGSRISSLWVLANTCRCSWLGWLPHPRSISTQNSGGPLSPLFHISASSSVARNVNLLRFAWISRLEAQVCCGDVSQIRPCSTVQNSHSRAFHVGVDLKHALWAIVHRGVTRRWVGCVNVHPTTPHPMAWIFQSYPASEECSGAIRGGAWCCPFLPVGRPGASPGYSSRPETSQGAYDISFTNRIE